MIKRVGVGGNQIDYHGNRKVRYAQGLDICYQETEQRFHERLLRVYREEEDPLRSTLWGAACAKAWERECYRFLKLRKDDFTRRIHWWLVVHRVVLLTTIHSLAIMVSAISLGFQKSADSKNLDHDRKLGETALRHG